MFTVEPVAPEISDLVKEYSFWEPYFLKFKNVGIIGAEILRRQSLFWLPS